MLNTLEPKATLLTGIILQVPDRPEEPFKLIAQYILTQALDGAEVLCLLSWLLFSLYLQGSNSTPFSYLITVLHSAQQRTAKVTLVL